MRISEDKGSREIVSLLMAASQLMAALSIFKPVITLIVDVVGKKLSKVKRPRILRRMIGYTGRNCKLRSLAYSVTDSIIDTIQHKPGGYTFWQSLPKR